LAKFANSAEQYGEQAEIKMPYRPRSIYHSPEAIHLNQDQVTIIHILFLIGPCHSMCHILCG